MDMQALIEEMNALVGKIKSGEATRGELEAFTAAASELYERAIVLRYKSYEAQIFGKESVVEVIPVTEVSEPVKEAIVNEPLPSDDKIVEAEQEFDLFASDENEDVEISEQEEIVSIIEKTPANEVIQENSVTEVIEVAEPVEVVEMVEATETVEIVELNDFSKASELPETVDPIIDSYHHQEKTIEDELVQVVRETVEEIEIHRTTTVTETVQVGETLPTIHSIYQKLGKDDNSLAARLMAVRLDTLKGAFGFNERIQIVQELFQGSNDSFSEAIEKLDNLNSASEARNVVTNYANQYSWNDESNLALEFVQKVERRYV